MTAAPGVGPLSAGQSEILRRALAREGGSDVSPGELYAVEVAADSVVLTERSTGSRRTLPVQGVRPLDATVSDRGDVAILADAPDGQGRLVGRLQPDGTFQQVGRSYGASSPELSADGSRLTWLSLYDVEEVGPNGPRHLGKVPYTADRSAFLEDGRLLVRSDRDPWATGHKVPYYWLVDPAGGVQALDDVPTAESLGVPVRDKLQAVHGRLFEGATPEQCRDLADLFGYRTPSYRALTPRRDKTVFWVEPGADGQAFGLYRMVPGKGSPQAALSPADAAAVGSKRVSQAEWQPGFRRVAVAYEGPFRKAAVVDFEGGSRLLPGELAEGGTRAPLWWSPDGRWLAVELAEGDRRAVHLYDVEADALYPVVPDGRVEGWKDGNLAVTVDGVRRVILPGPLDVSRGREYVLGPKPEDAGSIEVGEGEVQVGDVRLPVRRP